MSIACFHANESCGESRGKSDLVKLTECRDNIQSHLLKYHLSRDKLTEYELILARAGKFDVNEDDVSGWLVCPKHRYGLGKYWLPSQKSCNMKNHSGALKALSGRDVVTYDIAKWAQKLYGLNVPLGAAICCPCRKSLRSLIKAKNLDNEHEFLESDDVTSRQRSAKQDAAEALQGAFSSPLPVVLFEDSEWLPETPDILGSEKNDQALHAFNECFSTLSSLFPDSCTFTPLQSRLKSSWDETSKEQQTRCLKTAAATCKMVCEVIAPGAKDELFESLTEVEKDTIHISKELEALMAAYQNAPTKSLKTQILSIYVNWYPVKTLFTLHEKYEKITEWQVRKAKEHSKTAGPGLPVEKVTRHRVRVDMDKVDHFLDFINRPYFYQDVAFGTRELELESGEILSMPNVVRTVTRSTMISQYLSYCEEEEVESLSRSTLFRILEVRKASQRRSLQGLDNTAADGAAAFDTLDAIADQLEKLGATNEWTKTTKSSLRDSKKYLKTQYKVHCRESSSCADHCYTFALSDEKNKKFQESCHDEHNSVCKNCEELKNAIQEIESKCQDKTTIQCDEERREDLLYDIKNSKKSIENWKAHILRSENQDRAKQDALRCVNANTIVILIDWAMKFTQIKYREKQSEWYGKRGLNWHISSVISLNTTGKLQVISYAHLFDSCTQDWFAVISILENLLAKVKADNPSITQAYLRSDEAGCYHNNFIIAALKDVGQRVGIKVVRYDFSEPQHGKDLCDRILCPMKASIRKFCNEGNDVTRAADMRNALKERPVKGTTASVNTVNIEAKESEVTKLEGFSAFHNFCFEDGGVRVWKAYGIGDGRLIPYDKWQSTPQGPTLLKVEQGHDFFTPSSNRVLKEPASTKEESVAYQCPEGECYAVFTKLEDLELHVAVGHHISKKRLGFYDQLKLDWVSRFTELTLEEKSTGKSQYHESKGDVSKNLSIGWALQKPRGGGKRYPKDVKNYLFSKYDLGEKTGNKCDPQQVANDMRKAKTETGERRFARDDWLTKAQIRSFFSRVTAARRKQSQQQLETPSSVADQDIDPESEELDEWLEEIEEIEDIEERNNIKNEVLKEIALKHPVIYDAYNLCDLNRTEGLSKFSVKMLKEICNELEIKIKSRDKKIIIIEKLKEELMKCSCNN